MQVPVIHLDTHGIQTPQLLWSGISVETTTESLGKMILTLIAPPDTGTDSLMLARFLGQRLSRRKPAMAWPLFLAISGLRGLSKSDFKPVQPDHCSGLLKSCVEAGPETGTLQEKLNGRLIPRFGEADAAASHFARNFRSGFVANFGLAALAVVLAMTGLLLPQMKLPLIVSELGVILLIMVNTRAGTHAKWHESWMDYRHIAEELRVRALLSLLGDPDIHRNETHGLVAAPGWVDWIVRASASELGLPSAVANGRYLEKVRTVAFKMIDEQLAYHTRLHTMFHSLNHRLHRAGTWLFGGTAFACTAWTVAKIFQWPMILDDWLDLTALVTAITAAFPAMAAALYGIRMQGDFSGIASHSRTTVGQLERFKTILQADVLDFELLKARLHQLSGIMLANVASWRTTYQAKPLTLPG
jgi:hypothetical protein